MGSGELSRVLQGSARNANVLKAFQLCLLMLMNMWMLILLFCSAYLQGIYENLLGLLSLHYCSFYAGYLLFIFSSIEFVTVVYLLDLICLMMTIISAKKMEVKINSTSWHQHWTSTPIHGCGQNAVGNTSLSFWSKTFPVCFLGCFSHVPVSHGVLQLMWNPGVQCLEEIRGICVCTHPLHRTGMQPWHPVPASSASW